jgi:hypothetical protein
MLRLCLLGSRFGSRSVPYSREESIDEDISVSFPICVRDDLASAIVVVPVPTEKHFGRGFFSACTKAQETVSL